MAIEWKFIGIFPKCCVCVCPSPSEGFLAQFHLLFTAFSSLGCVLYIDLIDEKIDGDVCGIGTEFYILILYNLFLKKWICRNICLHIDFIIIKSTTNIWLN